MSMSLEQNEQNIQEILQQSDYMKQTFGNMMPEIQYLDRGSDSEVFLLKSDRGQKVLKIYHTQGLNVQNLLSYQNYTNRLNNSLTTSPFTIECAGHQWSIEVTPIYEVGQDTRGVPYTISPFVSGDHLQDIFAKVNKAYHENPRSAETEVTFLPTLDGQEIEVPYPQIKNLFEEGFWIVKKDRTEKEIEQELDNRAQGLASSLDLKT